MWFSSSARDFLEWAVNGLYVLLLIYGRVRLNSCHKTLSPPPPSKVVVRARLIERLDEGLSEHSTPGVTLISAPAAFGYPAIGLRVS
jgi:hypothetical protein